MTTLSIDKQETRSKTGFLLSALWKSKTEKNMRQTNLANVWHPRSALHPNQLSHDAADEISEIVSQEKRFQVFTRDDLIKIPRETDGHLLPAVPALDGIEHICVNFYGQTQCGKMMSNFYQHNFEHPYFGKFNNIEAFWQWLKSTSRPDCLRDMHAKEAKTFGKTLVKRVVPHFYEAIIDANYHRILQNPQIREEVYNSTLPFEYYYLHPVSRIPIHPNDREQQIFYFELLRKWIQGEAKPLDLDYDKILMG